MGKENSGIRQDQNCGGKKTAVSWRGTMVRAGGGHVRHVVLRAHWRPKTWQDNLCNDNSTELRSPLIWSQIIRDVIFETQVQNMMSTVR